VPRGIGAGGNGLSRRPRRSRIVLKLGSRVLTGGSGAILPERIRMYAAAIAANRDVETVLVSSGAVAAGYPSVGYSKVPADARKRQTAAAVGQTLLMHRYTEAFMEHGISIGQVLLTADSIHDRRRYVNARQAFSAMFAAGVVPVVNENDAIAADETDTKVGDNVYDGDPTRNGARVIPFAATAAELRPYCYRKRGGESRGGMHTKLEAAEKAAAYGVPTVIASGSDPQALDAVYAGHPTGTRIAAATDPLNAHHHWMAVQRKPRGEIVVDDGALRALRDGSSLLASGVLRPGGRVAAGDLVAIVDASGHERARGITRFDDREVERIRGRHSSEIEALLGYRAGTTVVRSDKLVILDRR
jgi:glutamate 5-kinase